MHCRLLLLHLADPMAALQKLADSVAPGGVLLVEEWDYATTQAYQHDHPLVGDVVNRVNEALFGLTLSMGINVWLGRDLPDMVEATGLRDVDHVGSLRITRGTPEPTMQKASAALLRPALVGRNLVAERRGRRLVPRLVRPDLSHDRLHDDQRLGPPTQALSRHATAKSDANGEAADRPELFMFVPPQADHPQDGYGSRRAESLHRHG